MVRLPQSYSEIIGENAHVYEVESNGKRMFLISFDETVDKNLFVPPNTQLTLEERLERIEKHLGITQ